MIKASIPGHQGHEVLSYGSEGWVCVTCGVHDLSGDHTRVHEERCEGCGAIAFGHEVKRTKHDLVQIVAPAGWRCLLVTVAGHSRPIHGVRRPQAIQRLQLFCATCAVNTRRPDDDDA